MAHFFVLKMFVVAWILDPNPIESIYSIFKNSFSPCLFLLHTVRKVLADFVICD